MQTSWASPTNLHFHLICLTHHVSISNADKKVFPNFFILGWYSTGSDAQESDMQIHKAVNSAFLNDVFCIFWSEFSLFDDNLLMGWFFFRIFGDGY